MESMFGLLCFTEVQKTLFVA
jgi:hypothetical protein